MFADRVFSLLAHESAGLVIALALLALAGWRLRAAPSRPVRWLLRGLALAGLLLAAGAASHLLRHAATAKAYPPPGRMVDVGGYEIHVLAEGPRDAPAVVWFGGGHSPGVVMFHLHAMLRGEVRSILVDRPGTGWSDTGPFPRTTAREVEETVRALEAAGERGPYLWVGHSFGGLLAANIARRHPEHTAGVVLLDATPLDVIFYGLDHATLGSFRRGEIVAGVRRLFGLYRARFDDVAPPRRSEATGLVEIDAPMPLGFTLQSGAGERFAGASIYEELTAEGLIDRAFDTAVFDGDLGDTPLYLVAPGVDDPSTVPYSESVAGPGERARRFARFLQNTREGFLGASSRSQRIHAPEGSGHNFPVDEPQFVVDTLRGILAELNPGTRAPSADASAAEPLAYEQLTTAWPGPYGGVPPVDRVTPAALEAALRRAVDEKRAEVRAIATNPAPPDFENTVLALERAGVALDRAQRLLAIFTSTASDEAYAGVAARTAALAPALAGELAHDPELFARVDAVHAGLPGSAPDDEARRLVEVVHGRFLRAGAALDAPEKARLREIDARLAELRTAFARNASQAEANTFVFVEDAAELEGLPEQRIAAADAAARAQERPGAWAIQISRPSVWPVLTHARSRDLRERVWRRWASRGGEPGAYDNRPVMTEMLALRGEKARLLGHPSFAHWQTSARMIGTPEAAMDLLMDAWNALLGPTRDELAALQALANEQGADFELEPWDRLYYAERYRQRHFGFDAAAVEPYLALPNIVEAMFWAAGELYGFRFERLEGVPVVADGIDVYEVRRGGEVQGVLWLDLFQRAGKGPASWASEYRPARRIDGRTLPLVALHSAAQPAVDGGPVGVPWERANVIFHEFGHTLHTLAYGGRYPSLGSVQVPWDFVEAPSLLNERWLRDPGLLERFARHFETGEPVPEGLLRGLFAALDYDRVFSASLNYLGTAIVDMRLHLLADGREIDALEVEREVLAELGLPRAVDLVLYAPHAYHTFSERYAAGVYTYLWSDVIAADAAEAFGSAPGGLYDGSVAGAWYEHVLSAGNTVPVEEAYRAFRGRDPDPEALLRRFGLAPPATE